MWIHQAEYQLSLVKQEEGGCGCGLVTCGGNKLFIGDTDVCKWVGVYGGWCGQLMLLYCIIIALLSSVSAVNMTAGCSSITAGDIFEKVSRFW